MNHHHTLNLTGSATLNVVVTLPGLELLMSQLSDQIAALSASVDAATTRVQEDVAALQAQIADLETKVANNPTPEDLAALDALKTKLDQLDPVTSSTVPAS